MGLFLALVFLMKIFMGSYCTFKLKQGQLITWSSHWIGNWTFNKITICTIVACITEFWKLVDYVENTNTFCVHANHLVLWWSWSGGGAYGSMLLRLPQVDWVKRNCPIICIAGVGGMRGEGERWLERLCSAENKKFDYTCGFKRRCFTEVVQSSLLIFLGL